MTGYFGLRTYVLIAAIAFLCTYNRATEPSDAAMQQQPWVDVDKESEPTQQQLVQLSEGERTRGRCLHSCPW